MCFKQLIQTRILLCIIIDLYLCDFHLSILQHMWINLFLVTYSMLYIIVYYPAFCFQWFMNRVSSVENCVLVDCSGLILYMETWKQVVKYFNLKPFTISWSTIFGNYQTTMTCIIWRKVDTCLYFDIIPRGVWFEIHPRGRQKVMPHNWNYRCWSLGSTMIQSIPKHNIGQRPPE